MTFGSIVATILVGAVIGALGRFVVKGTQHLNMFVTVLLGIVAAFVGTWLAELFGVNDTRGIDWIELFLQIGVAAILVAIVARSTAKPGATPRSASAASIPPAGAAPMPPPGIPNYPPAGGPATPPSPPSPPAV